MLLFASFAGPVFSQDPTAPEAGVEPEATNHPTVIHQVLHSIRRRTGRQATKVAELRGENGVPFPTSWEVLFYDPASPSFLTEVSGAGRAIPAKNLYADGLPPSYFDLDRLKMDLKRVFEIAEAEAIVAKVKFDKVDWSLRTREFSQEPIWRLKLLNNSRQIQGIVDLSAETGRLYRSVWLDRAGGDIQVRDSLLGSTSMKVDPVKPADSGDGADAEGEATGGRASTPAADVPAANAENTTAGTGAAAAATAAPLAAPGAGSSVPTGPPKSNVITPAQP